MNVLWALELAKDGSRNLVRHKLRSTLTLLGVVFGVGAVITMLAIGEGGQRTVLKEIEGLGLNNILIDSVQPPEALRQTQSDQQGIRLFQYGLTERDLDQIRATFPDAGTAVGHLVKQKVYRRSTRVDSTALGVPADYFNLFRTEVIYGRLLSPLDDASRERVAVLTESVAESLVPGGRAVGEKIRIGPHYFEVVGVARMPSVKSSGTV